MLSTLTALAEPNRLRIVELLRESPRPVNELVQELHLSQPLVSKHLKVLSQAGLVKAQPLAQQRIYMLEEHPFLELDDWLSTFRRAWNERLDNLEGYVQELKAQQDEERGQDDPDETSPQEES